MAEELSERFEDVPIVEMGVIGWLMAAAIAVMLFSLLAFQLVAWTLVRATCSAPDAGRKRRSADI